MKRVDGPVRVREIKQSSTDTDIFQVVLEQEVIKPIKDAGSLLSVLMQGHVKFGSHTQMRVAYQNMSTQAIAKFNLKVGSTWPADWCPRIAVHEFCEGDTIPEGLVNYYKSTTFVPRTWKQDDTIRKQTPKMTPPAEGREQIVLERYGHPIYRGMHFTVQGMDQEDYLIQHTNEIVTNFNTAASSVTQVGEAVQP